MNTLRYSMTATLLCLLSIGCGGGVERTNVAGTATFDGQPIVYGSIQFVPTTGTAGSATIRDGKFDTAVDGQGVIGGPHRAIITAFDAVPAGAAATSGEGEEGGEVGSEAAPVDETAAKKGAGGPLFSGYVVEVDITGPTLDINVPADAAGASQDSNAGGESSDP